MLIYFCSYYLLRSAAAFFSLQTCSVSQPYVTGFSSSVMSKSANQIKPSDDSTCSVTAPSWDVISNFLVPLSKKNLQETQDEITVSKVTEQDPCHRSLKAFSFPHLLLSYPFLHHHFPNLSTTHTGTSIIL